MKLSDPAFDHLVEEALRQIPEEIRIHLDNLLISVQKQPTPEILAEAGLGPEDTLLGFYRGVPLPERSAVAPPLYPDTIYLFKKPLEEFCSSLEELQREIEITVVHEIAHFIGMGERRLMELGYG